MKTDGSMGRSEGRVRGLAFGDTEAGAPYARIRLAGQREYFMDFDDPDGWHLSQNTHVRITWVSQVSKDGHTYFVILDHEALDDAG